MYHLLVNIANARPGISDIHQQVIHLSSIDSSSDGLSSVAVLIEDDGALESTGPIPTKPSLPVTSSSIPTLTAQGHLEIADPDFGQSQDRQFPNDLVQSV